MGCDQVLKPVRKLFNCFRIEKNSHF
jgi:hypothetical protein